MTLYTLEGAKALAQADEALGAGNIWRKCQLCVNYKNDVRAAKLFVIEERRIAECKMSNYCKNKFSQI
ncbi:MAG: hypothetical protein ACLRXQ_00485 [Phascolarctobacterium faecium]